MLKYGPCICFAGMNPNTNVVNPPAIFVATSLISTRFEIHQCSFYDVLTNFAYQLPDAFKDFAAANVGGKGPNDAFMTHCHRELLHAQWRILLDDEFLEAYKHGIAITCCDGIGRHFYPRFFTYSANYPEKYGT